MNSVHITYDSEGDILYLSFGSPREATGYQLSDQLLLRLLTDSDQPAGLTIFNFLHHIHSGVGIKLNEDEIEENILNSLSSPPISRFLYVRKGKSGTTAHLLQPSLQETISVMNGTNHVS